MSDFKAQIKNARDERETRDVNKALEMFLQIDKAQLESNQLFDYFGELGLTYWHLKKFDEAIGFNKLKLVHLNDSKGGLGSKIDRHEHIGLGKIGEEGFRNILKSKLRALPLILETPMVEKGDDIDNLKKVRDLSQ